MTHVDLNKPARLAARTGSARAVTEPRSGLWDELRAMNNRLRHIEDAIDDAEFPPPPPPWPWLAVVVVWLTAGAVVTTAIIVFGRAGNEYVGDTGVLSLIGALAATWLILRSA